MIKIPVECKDLKCPAYHKCCFLPTEYILDKNNCVKVLFIGQGGGTDERKLQRPFVGKAGIRLKNIIMETFKRLNVSFGIGFSNTIRDNPENNRIPTKEEYDHCLKYLLADIVFLKKKGLESLVLLGNATKEVFLPTEGPISHIHGNRYRITINDEIGEMIVMSTYHPSFVVRNGYNFNPDNKYDKEVIEDLLGLFKHLIK